MKSIIIPPKQLKSEDAETKTALIKRAAFVGINKKNNGATSLI